VALLGIARPDEQSALRVGRRYWEFSGAFVSPVQTMDKRSCHLRIEFKIEVAHGGFSVRSARRPGQNVNSAGPARSRCAPVGQAIGDRRIPDVLPEASAATPGSPESIELRAPTSRPDRRLRSACSMRRKPPRRYRWLQRHCQRQSRTVALRTSSMAGLHCKNHRT
jgi:hypothetical protein